MNTRKMIIVDLTEEKIQILPMRADLERDYMGGEGTGTRLVWEMVKPRTEPLTPGNAIVFATAPLNGTIFPAAARGTVVFKSPETGTISMSNIGGKWAAMLRFAGYELVAVTGRARRPAYLLIEDDRVQLLDARAIWGTTIPDMQARLQEQTGHADLEVLGIGPAGERVVRFSCVANNIRFAGKGGSGAVMGSKNLKAIAIRGTGMVPVCDLESLRDVSFDVMIAMKDSPPIQMLKKGSSAAFNQTVAEIQDFGYKHFQQAGWTDKKLYIENIAATLHEESRACYACPIGCGVISRIKKGRYRGTETGGPMAEAYWNWGWKCGITDVEAICKIAELCNKNGVCVNSASELAAWVMECQERGLLSTEETGGLHLNWGDGHGSVRLMEMIIKREGFGNILAEGVKRAAEKTGEKTKQYAMHVKGMELDGDEWRQNKASALTAATSERGASVVRPWGFPIDMGVLFSDITGLKEKPDPAQEKGIAAWYKPYKEFTVVSNCVGVCLYPALFNIPDVRQTMRGFTAVTGRPLKLEEYLRIGERTICVQRAFNAREGFDRKDDTLPKRLLSEPVRGGKYDGRRISDLDAMLDEYYRESGFDTATGWPTRAKLESLDLQDAADELYPRT